MAIKTWHARRTSTLVIYMFRAKNHFWLHGSLKNWGHDEVAWFVFGRSYLLLKLSHINCKIFFSIEFYF